MKDIHPEIQGNLLLQNIMDSEIEIWDVPHEAVFGDAMSNKLDQVADHLKAKGYNPFIIRHAYPDISTILSSVGWVSASVEIFQQIESLKIKPRRILLAAATGGTMSGLILGSKYLGAAYKPMGISVWMGKRDVEARILQRANGVSEYLKLGIKVTPEDIEIMDEYIGERYGIPTEEGIAALKLVAKTEGIILDPVYTSKAMSGVIDLIRKGEFTYEDTIIFIHTGGIPPLFAYHKEAIQ
jgi:1-aminocyclopropane-1-carboxylate deaminase/D-cysteine desulfhydrase-like pyridoxal-dependent ACC family enzyme